MDISPDKQIIDVVFSNIDCCYIDEEFEAVGDDGAYSIALSWRDGNEQMLGRSSAKVCSFDVGKARSQYYYA